MIRFENDYAEGAHPQILQRLVATNEEQSPGYGMDEHSEKARAYIKKSDCSGAGRHSLFSWRNTNEYNRDSVYFASSSGRHCSEYRTYCGA